MHAGLYFRISTQLHTSDDRLLELHLLYVLVLTHNLVANLHHELKGNVCLLDRDHHSAQVRIAALEQAANLLFGAATQLVYLLKCI